MKKALIFVLSILLINLASASIIIISPQNNSKLYQSSFEVGFIPNINNISSCSVYTQKGIYNTKQNIISNEQNNITILNINESSDFYSNKVNWWISCRDIYNNITNSEIYFLDTIKDTIIINETNNEKNPKYIIIDAPKNWSKNSQVTIKLSIYNNNNNKYYPKDIKFDTSKSDTSFIQRRKLIDETIEAKFNVFSNAELGENLIKIIINDERILEYDLIFNIEEESIKTNDEEIFKNFNKLVIWIAGIGLFSIIFLVLLLLVISEKKRRR